MDARELRACKKSANVVFSTACDEPLTAVDSRHLQERAGRRRTEFHLNKTICAKTVSATFWLVSAPLMTV